MSYKRMHIQVYNGIKITLRLVNNLTGKVVVFVGLISYISI